MRGRCDGTRIRPFQGRSLVGACLPGALPPATFFNPLRGSKTDSAEDALEARGLGKTLYGPLGLNCSDEKNNSSSFWRDSGSLGDDESLWFL
jgi:hypothetical protein